MLVRLAFAVMIQVDADILLIDEVLAVGDAAFQQKCFDEFVRIREAGKTILLVTHDMGAVHRFCDRAMLLERGRVVDDRRPDDVGNRYLELNFSEAARDDAAHGREPVSTERMGDGDAEIVEAGSRTRPASASRRVPAGGRCTFAARVRFVARRRRPAVRRRAPERPQRDTILAASNAVVEPARRAASAPGRRSTYRVTFDNLLAPGRYHATPAVARQGGGIAWLDRRERMLSLLVSGVAAHRRGRRPARTRSSVRARRAERGRRERADAAPLGPPIKGPSALGSDPRRFWHLTRTLAVTDFKLRFFGSALGYLWQLMRPLLLFGVLYVVFTQVVRIGGDVELYPVALLLGIVLFTFFTEATGGALGSLVDREALIRKVEFPRLAVPLAAVLTALFNVALNLIAVFVFLLAAGGERAAELARAAVPRARAGASSPPASGCCSRRCSSATATSSRSGTSRCRSLFYGSPIFYPIDVVARSAPSSPRS